MKITVTPFIDYKSKDIYLTTNTFIESYYSTVYRELIKTKDKAVREALIKLGWTPPENEK